MWADECEMPFPPDLPKELKELPVHCERRGVPDVGYLIPRRTASVRFAPPPSTPQYVITANPFSTLQLPVDDEGEVETPEGTDAQSPLPAHRASRPPSPDPPEAEPTPTPLPPHAEAPSASHA